MTITSLVENTSETELRAVHGLSLLIETKRHRILFDLGPDRTLFENAEKRKIDLSAVDTVILSHGHNDHGGALREFLKINTTASVYLQRDAFLPHFSKALPDAVPIGLEPDLQTHPQILLLDGDHRIDEELSLFTVTRTDRCHSPANDVLYEGSGRDLFRHEQNLILSGEKTALIMGCGHTGIVNILEKAAPFRPQVCIGGFHLNIPSLNRSVPDTLLEQIAGELNRRKEIEFYTCHCTGLHAYEYLSARMGHLHYLSCGQTLEIR